MKRAAAFFVGISLALFGIRAAARTAGFTPSLSKPEGRPGDAVELSIPYDGSLGEVAAFLVRVEFDPEIFEFQSGRRTPELRDAYSGVLLEEDWIGSGYVMRSGERGLTSPCETFTYRFKVREGAAQGRADFSVSVYQVRDSAGNLLASADTTLSYEALPPFSSEAALTSLRPSEGELTPSFSPDQFEYQISLPFAVTSLTFFTEPAEGAACKVNRKNLGAGGSDTEFLLTVTAEDGNTKAVYKITAHREEKTPSPSPEPAPSPADKPKRTAEPEPVQTPRPESDESPPPSPNTAILAGQEATPLPSPPNAGGQPVFLQKQGEAAAGRDFTVRGNGEISLPFLCIFGFSMILFALSGPLAKWLCAKFPGGSGKEQEGKREEDSGDTKE